MRSRYTAYTRGDIDYIKSTLTPAAQRGFDATAAKKWATSSKWLGLKIQAAEKGSPTDTTGVVDFTATYEKNGEGIDHHEVAEFRKTKEGRWLFVDGEAHTHKAGEGHHDHTKPATVVREGVKIGRNDPCSCGSGKKFKKCCAMTA